MARLSLILGGARSGKSARALALAEAPRVFIATAEALDDEMAERIRRHHAERGPDWGLAEAPLELAAAVRDHSGERVTLVVDCLTLWLSNLMHHGRDADAEIDALVLALAEAPGRVVLVSNEVGLGLAPVNALGRAFRDAQGRLNQRIAGAADHVEFVAAGLPLILKGAP
ncbi:MAG TPA: bifunctional adenosylcobinamide kinase/adenosylcobinamide-phosphate guanylyltransferase [Thermohalobaculum sp.]|nr:bifunctional adenosylcobinamide kinase/adenosylcobinamide-phosphate guanylyltransferase [Thermohalobaculum sp.]